MKKNFCTTGMRMVFGGGLLIAVVLLMQVLSPSTVFPLATMLSNHVEPIDTGAGDPCPAYGTTMTREATAVSKDGLGWTQGSTTMTVSFFYTGNCNLPAVSNLKCSSRVNIFPEDVHITKCSANDPFLSDGLFMNGVEDDAIYSTPFESGEPISIKIEADQYGNIHVTVNNNVPPFLFSTQ